MNSVDKALPLPSLDPDQVQLKRSEGALYLDVRTPEEFALGHLVDAWNIPVMLGSVAGLSPNPDFLKVALSCLPHDVAIVLGCHSGGRARTAGALLRTQGFQVFADKRGWHGSTDAFGRLSPGWCKLGVATEQGAYSAHSYLALRGRAGL